MKIRDFILPSLAVASLLYATQSIVRTQPVRELTEPPAPPPQSSFRNCIAAVGLVEPSSEAISIGSARPGVVDEVMVTVGDQVKKDQPLLRLRTSELRAERAVADASLKQALAQVDVAKAQVRVAESQVGVADAELAQSKRLQNFADGVKDIRVLSDEERSQRAMTVATQESRRMSAQASVAAARSSVSAAEAAVNAAKASVDVLDVEIDRCTIKAPLDATILQLRIRSGEQVGVSPGQDAWITLGQTNPFHIRADVDEHEAWRVRPGVAAEAQVRGNPKLKAKLSFVRIEPLVIPKRSLTGDSTERVDTRVLQVIFKIEPTEGIFLYPGQQMDVFFDAPQDIAAQ